jgi:pimeloyl-ACP methyl ester carboxylesterase
MPDLATEHRTVSTADGRQLEVLAVGPADGLPLVFHSGTPAGLVSYGPMEEAAAERGLRLVQYARPGYGDSTAAPGRRVADAAGDVAVVLDDLGADSFVTAGWSGGGPHALATAAGLNDRCRAVASIAGVAPYQSPGLDWLGGMAAENVAEFGATIAGEAELTAFLTAEAAQLREVTADQIVEGMGTLVSAVDIAVMTGEFARFLAAGFRAALATGIAGWRDDDLAFVQDWGVELDRLGAGGVPIAIWQGDQDMMVPFAHGQWLADHIAGVSAHLLPGQGHLSLAVGHFGAILDDLQALAGTA